MERPANFFLIALSHRQTGQNSNDQDVFEYFVEQQQNALTLLSQKSLFTLLQVWLMLRISTLSVIQGRH
jgi:hypothetical protein